MAYATKNKRRSYATIICIVYIVLTMLAIIPHRFFSRYAHPTTLLSTASMLVPVILGFLYFLRTMNKWIDGAPFNVAKKTLLILPNVIFFATLFDYAILIISHNYPMYQALSKMIQISFYTGAITIVMMLFLIFLSNRLPEDERMEKFFISLNYKTYAFGATIALALTYLLIGFNVYQAESTSVEAVANETRLDMNTMVSSINDYVSYLAQQTKVDTDFISLSIANNRNLSEEVLLSRITTVDNEAKDFYTEVELHIDHQNQNIHLRINPLTDETLNVTHLNRSINVDTSGYAKIIEYSDIYINYDSIFQGEILHSYITIVSMIRVNSEVVGYLKVVTSAKHLKNIISAYVYPLSEYFIYNRSTGDITSSYDTQSVSHGLQNLFTFDNWPRIADQLFNVDLETPRLMLDERDIYYLGNSDHVSYFVFAEYVNRLDLVFFQIIQTDLLFDIGLVNRQYTVVILSMMSLLVILMILFKFFIDYTIKPLRLAVDYTNNLKEEKKQISDKLVKITNDEAGMILINTNAFFSSLDGVLSNLKKESTSLDADFYTLSDILNANIAILKSQIASVNETVDSISSVLASIFKINDATTQQKYAFSSANVAIDELLKVISTIEENMEIQSSAVEQTSASIEEIISNISSVARNVNTADSYAKKLVEEGRTGGEIVDEVIDAVKEIEDNSDQIKEIITVIQGIAEQTNLLAMNAAIEAAHAGEQGKGFAIVADEIRSLAEHTADNTKSVTSIIREITKRVANTVSLAVGSGNSLDSIINISERTARVISDINIANSEIEIGGKEILETVKNLNTITKKIKDGVEAQVQNSQIVENQVATLNSITENVSNAITESIVGSNHVNEGLTSLTELSEKSKGSNETLNEAITKLNVSFGQFNSFVDSFDIDIKKSESKESESALEAMSKYRKLRRKEKKKLSLQSIVEEIAFMEETDIHAAFNKEEEDVAKEAAASTQKVEDNTLDINATDKDSTNITNDDVDINDLFKGVGNVDEYDMDNYNNYDDNEDNRNSSEENK